MSHAVILLVVLFLRIFSVDISISNGKTYGSNNIMCIVVGPSCALGVVVKKRFI